MTGCYDHTVRPHFITILTNHASFLSQIAFHNVIHVRGL